MKGVIFAIACALSQRPLRVSDPVVPSAYATPLPALNKAQLPPRNIQVDPSTTGVNPIRSHNSFDLSGIFSRMDPDIKDEDDEPYDNNAGLHTVPLAPSKASSMTEEKKDMKVGISLSSIPTLPESALRDLETLHKLEANAEEALRNDQMLKFDKIQREILLYQPRILIPELCKHKVVHSAVQDAAKRIHDRLSEEELGRDHREHVWISSGTPDPNVLKFSSENSWDPKSQPKLLPHELQNESTLKPEINCNGAHIWFKLQNLLDLGYAYLKKATIPHSNADNNVDPDRMTIIGYQLFFLAAMIHLERSLGPKTESLHLLYLIRDAEYETGTSDLVKDCLGRFDRDLTAKALRYKLEPEPEKRWERGPREGLSLRKKALKGRQDRRKRKIAYRAEVEASGSGRAGHDE
ncbi:hypothetical protein H0H93_014863 [Arthromyces matolae]|nr:hypothetical protein H0H93_014863 [Arthromyces matolae]